jgi:hypothetical protein
LLERLEQLALGVAELLERVASRVVARTREAVLDATTRSASVLDRVVRSSGAHDEHRAISTSRRAIRLRVFVKCDAYAKRARGRAFVNCSTCRAWIVC